MTTIRLGQAAAILVAGLVLGALAALLAQAGNADFSAVVGSHLVWRALGFTLLQATLSTVLSCALALAAARSLAHVGDFRGRGTLLSFMSVPIVLPSLIAVFGIVAIYGNNGILATAIHGLGLDFTWNLYGLGGILIAHVFFNLPLALRLLLPAWNAIPAESWRLAAQLGIRGFDLFRLIEWPVLRRYLPQAAAIIFLICATSFAVILSLGGGPKAATLEILIFEALRFDANPPRAALLAILSLCLTLLVLLGAQRARKTLPLGTALSERYTVAVFNTRADRWPHRFIIGMALLMIAPPLFAAVLDGLFGLAFDLSLPASLGKTTMLSLAIAIPAGALGTLVALLISIAEVQARSRWSTSAAWLRACGALPIACSPMALALGVYLLLSTVMDGHGRTVVGIVLMNALVAIPFLTSILRPAIERSQERYQRLCLALGIRGWARWRHVDWPTLRGALGSAAALGVAFSLGDLVAVGLYGDPDVRTLNLLLYDQLSAYRMHGAAVTALFLMALVFLAYRLIERLIGGRHAT